MKKGTFFQKLKKYVFMLFTGLILLLILLLAISGYVKASVQDRILSPEEALEIKGDCILILGASVRQSRPSPMLEDRLLMGIALYEAGLSDRLLMSGDHGQDNYDEVNTMKAFALDQGIPSQDIFMDHAGFSTYESLYRARDVFQVERVIIVTQGYHLYRALYIAKGLGMDAHGVAADPRQYQGQTYREGREILARIKDFFILIFEPPPTYLGEPIPIHGDGDSTND